MSSTLRHCIVHLALPSSTGDQSSPAHPERLQVSMRSTWPISVSLPGPHPLDELSAEEIATAIGATKKHAGTTIDVSTIRWNICALEVGAKHLSAWPADEVHSRSTTDNWAFDSAWQ